MPLLHALAENVRAAVSSDDHGSTGMTTVAMYLSERGWGFPLIHDITDSLRIGDITFVNTRTQPRTFRTVEVKTKLTSEIPLGDGTANYTYQVHVMHPTHPGMDVSSVDLHAEEELSVDPIKTPPPAAPWTPRLLRQMRRMEQAIAKQYAVPGTITKVPGEDRAFLSVPLETKSRTHWKELRRIIRIARRKGYASEVVDGAMIYLAFYDDKGVSAESVHDSRFVSDLKASGILDRINPRFPNSIVVNQVPPQEDRGLGAFLPHFLYEVPHRALTDLLHGRLLLVVLANPARLVDVLEAVGLEVSSRTGRADLNPGAMVVEDRFRDGQGREWHAELHNLEWHALELIHEFKSTAHLKAAALRMRDATREAYIARHAQPQRPTGRRRHLK